MKFRKPRHLTTGGLFLRIDGGCDDCAAYSDLIDHGAGHFSLVVRHDHTCPYFARLKDQP